MRARILMMLLIAVMCLGAIPYGADLACVYVRPLDGRDEIYKGLGFPPTQWTDRYGGLSKRTLIMGNLSTLPALHSEIAALKKRVEALEKQLAPKDPNEVKK